MVKLLPNEDGIAPGGRTALTRQGVAIAVAVALYFLRGLPARAENHLDYKYESYGEEKDRMLIRTHSALFEQGLTSWMSVKGEFVYDGISGASPTGAPPPPGSSQVPTAHLEDIRRAAIFEPNLRWGRSTTTPQFSYSLERDYESYGVSLNQAFDFNEKNTTLILGAAHAFDTVMPLFWRQRQEKKDTTDFFIGVTQVLTAKTLLTANVTLGTANGYLSDPYKGVRFDGYPDPNALFPENRPGHKTRQVAYLSLTQFVEPLHGSAELAYRFSHDSFGIFSHTASLAWYFNFGKYVVFSPLFRYYEQSNASFYGVRFDGDPSDPESSPSVVIPEFYSADYRLSALQSFTYGAGVTVRITKWLSFDAAYKRYQMEGLNSATPASNFPVANVYTVGMRLWF